MNKIILCIPLIFLSCPCFSQSYISLAPSLTNSSGTILDTSNIALELGQQWDVFSLGLDFGKIGKQLVETGKVYD